MAAPPELHQDAVLRFLAQSGGRARNADLLDHFRGFLHSPDPQRRAEARQRFKEMVNAVAIVKQEPGSGGAKYVQLRKKYRSGGGVLARGGAAQATAPASANSASEEADPQLAPEEETPRLSPVRKSGGGDVVPEAPQQPEAKREGAATTGSPSPSGPEAASSPGAEQRPLSGCQKQPDAPQRTGRQEGEQAPPEEEGSSPPSLAAPAAASGALPPAAATATPRSGRKNFRERVLMGSSPQLKHGRERDSDSTSQASSSAEEESSSSSSSNGGSVALDPLEHAWMLCASEGRWESLAGLLSCEPALLSKRDFVTGFTCLHWAAKHGRHELLALLVNFAHRHRLPVDVNARTSGGYTALHLAAMHGHLEVVKLLVGAYDADVEVRDYSGRKAWHYLSRGTADQVRHLAGALQDDEADGGTGNGSGRWRLSKVLPSNLIAYKLSSHLHHGEDGEPGDGAGGQGKGKEWHRKSAGSGRIKPRLNKIRFRTQIIHTTPSFRADPEEQEGQEEKPLKSSFKLRPKSNVFG